MIFSKKSQAGIELIVNYAWIIMIIILSIGLIHYLGFFNMDSILPNSYVSSGNLLLDESLVVPEMTDEGNAELVSSIYLNLVNTYKIDINITHISLIRINDFSTDILCFENSNFNISRDLTGILYCHINNYTLESMFDSNSVDLVFNMTFKGIDSYNRDLHDTFLYVRTKNFIDEATFCKLSNKESISIHDTDGIQNCGES